MSYEDELLKQANLDAFEKLVWNAAIDAAVAELLKSEVWNGKPYSDIVKRLKK